MDLLKCDLEVGLLAAVGEGIMVFLHLEVKTQALLQRREEVVEASPEGSGSGHLKTLSSVPGTEVATHQTPQTEAF